MLATHKPRSTSIIVTLLLFVGTALAPMAAWGHNFELSEVRLEFHGESERQFEIHFSADLDALALGADPATDSARLTAQLEAKSSAEIADLEEKLRRLFERRVRLRFAGQPAPFTVTFPDAGQDETFFGLTAKLVGSPPAGARSFTFFASRAFPPVRLLFKTAAGTQVHWLQRGEISPEIALTAAASPVSWSAALASHIRLGYRHILPLGIDHILFVLGLFLLGCRWRPLLWQVSAFTLAHTLTLALASYGVVSLPQRPVEVLIALSIAWVAIENLWTDRLQPWRPAMVFAFGLLHGLGFAAVLNESVLNEVGLPLQGKIPALLGFNLGVELGQLTVLALALGLLGPWRNRPGYRRWITVPLSTAIALVGLFWAVQRFFG